MTESLAGSEIVEATPSAAPAVNVAGRQYDVVTGFVVALMAWFVARLDGLSLLQPTSSKPPARWLELTGSLLLTPISDASALTGKVSLPLVVLPSLISHVPSALRHSTIGLAARSTLQPGFVAPDGVFQTTVSSTFAPGGSCPKLQVRTSLESKVPHDDATGVAVSAPDVTGGAITYLVCVNMEPPSFENVALYAMFSPYVTAPGPGWGTSVPVPSRFPAPPAATAIAAPVTARQATTRRQRVRFISFSLPLLRSDAHPTRRTRIMSDGREPLQAQRLLARNGAPRAGLRCVPLATWPSG